MKKRVMMTLTSEDVEKFQRLSKQLHLPYMYLSFSVDDYVRSMNIAMENCIKQGKTSANDLFWEVGSQRRMEEYIMESEGKRHDSENGGTSQ